MNRCAKCETTFDKWSDYYAHTIGVNCTKNLKPVNTSGRTKEQIVKDFEARNAKFISSFDDVTEGMRTIQTGGNK